MGDSLLVRDMAKKEQRWRMSVSGIVQGVGFRPFVVRLAQECSLTGWVGNTLEGVVIEAQGPVEGLEGFLAQLREQPPVLARIDGVSFFSLPLVKEHGFLISPSGQQGAVRTWVSPDMAVCPDCLAELFDPADRRFRYPFINCSNCGPRYTIIKRLPYDRAHTTMAAFAMCLNCRQEYEDPGQRRFHVQATCCPACGPQVRLLRADGQVLAAGDAALARALRHCADGRIVGVKGLGGFHLAVDAASPGAVARLRRKKGREAKPLAVMVRDLEQALALCFLGEKERAALESRERPIVLARKRSGHGLARQVAPGCDSLGIMLPYTPLHYLLLAGPVPALVMTSANISDEPICIDDAAALRRLGGVADFFLCHGRKIARPCDDSVVIQMAGEMRSLRRSRGQAPRPLLLSGEGPAVLGVGAELKNTVCFLKDAAAFISPHIGDLKNVGTYGVFRETIGHLSTLLAVQPELVVHDLHPGYLSSRWAGEQGRAPCLAVQHHHAHLAACLAENQVPGPAIGIILDGTGLGPDGTIWGGEVLLGDAAGYTRFAALEAMPLPGGDAAVREPWRTAVGYLFSAFDSGMPELPFLAGHDWGMITAMVEKKINTPLTSSCGRLFDAVAALGGGRQIIQYEAQAAVELMQQAHGRVGMMAFPCEIFSEGDMLRVSVRSLVRAVVNGLLGGMEPREVSRCFHQTMVEVFSALACEARMREKINDVVLSGGVFQNRLLFEALAASLMASGFRVLSHREVPCNDGAVSLGQAVIGRRLLQKE